MKIGIYFTIGDLGLNNSIHIFKGLIEGGVDLLEIGIPFSDPLLDGITIQQSHTRAVNEKISWEAICHSLYELKQLCHSKQQISIMTTAQHLYDSARRNKLPKLDGLLISDFRHDIPNPFPISTKRVWFLNQEIVLNSKNISAPEEISMIYLARLQGTTGENQKKEVTTSQAIQILKCKTDKDIWLGFGVSNKDDILEAKNQGASGAIIGSAFVKKVTDYFFNELKCKKNIEKELGLFNFSKKYIMNLKSNF